MAIIEVRNLVKKFKNFTAVADISFDVNKGEIFAFLGPNGAGKSTTIKMLTTLLSPTSGEILVNGIDPNVDKDGVRKSLGIVFQDASSDDDLTAWENMQFHAAMYGTPKETRDKNIEELLTFVELSDRKNDLVKTFSGGMKRRLEIARGLLHHPKILFLDEPTIGLDPQTRNHLWSYLQKVNNDERMTIFFTTHHMEEVEKIATRVAIIDHGKIVATGTVKELIKNNKSKTLEEAFLKLTGHEIREEEASGLDQMRLHHNIMKH